MRFCSRCGFPLTIVSQLVVNNGALVGFDLEGKRQLSLRQKGIRWGALLLIISGVLIPIVTLLTAMKHDAAVLFFPVLLVFLAGLARLLYALFLPQDAPMQKQFTSGAAAGMSAQSNAARRAGLPAPESVPSANWRQTNHTSALALPPSVTDNTTKLLNDEAERN